MNSAVIWSIFCSIRLHPTRWEGNMHEVLQQHNMVMSIPTNTFYTAELYPPCSKAFWYSQLSFHLAGQSSAPADCSKRKKKEACREPTNTITPIPCTVKHLLYCRAVSSLFSCLLVSSAATCSIFCSNRLHPTQGGGHTYLQGILTVHHIPSYQAPLNILS